MIAERSRPSTATHLLEGGFTLGFRDPVKFLFGSFQVSSEFYSLGFRVEIRSVKGSAGV